MLTRRKFSHLAAGASLGGASLLGTRKASSADAEFNYKFACSVGTDDPVTIYAQKVADRIKDETKGRLVIQIFANSQLGTENVVLSALRSGGVEFSTAPSNTLGNLTLMSQVSDIGFAYRDYETAWKSLDGDLGKIVRSEVAKFGITLMDKVWDSGFRQTYTSAKPLNSASDFNGLKIRVPVAPISFSIFKGMGAAPVSIGFAEVYSALQTHLADGMETAPIAFLNAKLFEVQKIVNVTNHQWGNYWIACNTAALNRLPPDIQKIVVTAFNEGADQQRQFNKKENIGAVDALKQKGMTVVTPSDPQSFRDALKKSGYYASWKEKFGNEAWTTLEKYSGSLA